MQGLTHVAMIVIVMIIAASNGQAQTYVFERLWPQLPQPWYLASPQGITTGNQGNIYVADTGFDCIRVFDSSGIFLREWGSSGSGDGQFSGPTGVAVDTAGNVVVADRGNRRIQVFDSSGRFLRKWGSIGNGDGQFNFPFGVAVDASGVVFVADTYNNRIQVFDSAGKFIRQWGSPGEAEGQFNLPQGVAVDASGKVYVADTSNYRIQVFDSAGTFLRKWGSSGGGDGEFEKPAGLAIDAFGNVFVADASFNNRIQVFDSAGTFLRKWGSVGIGDGRFNNLSGVAVDRAGNVFVADSNNNRIQVFNSSGAFQRKWGSSGSGDGQFNFPSSLAVDAVGNVFVVDSSNNRIQVFDSAGTFLRKWGSSGFSDGKFNSPSGVAVDASGNVFVADAFNNRIQVFDSSGTFLRKWGSSGSGDGQFNFPTAVTVDAAGNVFVADTFNNRIQVFDSSGAFLHKWGSSGSGDGQLHDPSGLAVDAAGSVFVADTATNRIQVFDSSGTFLRKWGSAGSGDGQFSYPYGVAVDTSGNVFVVDSNNHRLQVFDSSGTFLRKWGSAGDREGQFHFPYGVAVDTPGNVFVADTSNHRIQKFIRESATTDTSSLFYPRLSTSPSSAGNPDDIEYTGVAVANLGATDSSLTFTAFDTTGSLISGEGVTNPSSRTLKPGEQVPIVDYQIFGSGLQTERRSGWFRVESKPGKVVGFFLAFNESLSVLDGTDASAKTMTSFILPEIEDLDFTQIHVANPNTVPATVTFDLLKADGTPRVTSVSRSVNPNGAVAELFEQLFPGVAKDDSDYVRAASTQGVSPLEFLGKARQYVEALNGLDVQSGATTLYSPQYAVGGADWRTVLSVVNLDSSPATVTFRLIGNDGTPIGTPRDLSVPAKGKIRVTDQKFFLDPGGSLTQGYVEIKSDGAKLAGNVVFGDPARSAYSSALPLISGFANSFVFSQVASDKDYFTGIALLNPNDTDATTTINIFQKSGSLLAYTQETIPAKRRVSRLLTEYFPNLIGQDIRSGYIRITSNVGLAGFALFGTRAVLSAVPPQIFP
jgi:sugar lactone lactonase YvrE